MTITKHASTDKTFLDGLFEHILEQNNIDQQTVKAIIEFMKTSGYDSDALKEDVISNTDQQQSNLFNISNENMEFILICNRFISTVDCMFIFVSLFDYGLFVFVLFCLCLFYIINSGKCFVFNWTNIWLLV